MSKKKIYINLNNKICTYLIANALVDTSRTVPPCSENFTAVFFFFFFSS